MLYYRTHASRAGELPPELVGWSPPCPEPQLAEQTVGEHRVVGVVPQFVFAAPETGWVKLDAGWEIVAVGDFQPLWHARMASKWLVSPLTVDGATWLLPRVLNDKGTRAFKVAYGGWNFAAVLTTEQHTALDLATEIRTAHDAGALPDYPIRAAWAARLLGLTYHLSPTTLGVLGLGEELIDATLAVAGGYHGNN